MRSKRLHLNPSVLRTSRPNMALQRTRRPRVRSGRSLRSRGSPLNARPLGRGSFFCLIVCGAILSCVSIPTQADRTIRHVIGAFRGRGFSTLRSSEAKRLFPSDQASKLHEQIGQRGITWGEEHDRCHVWIGVGDYDRMGSAEVESINFHCSGLNQRQARDLIAGWLKELRIDAPLSEEVRRSVDKVRLAQEEVWLTRFIMPSTAGWTAVLQLSSRKPPEITAAA